MTSSQTPTHAITPARHPGENRGEIQQFQNVLDPGFRRGDRKMWIFKGLVMSKSVEFVVILKKYRDAFLKGAENERLQ